jgi:hypothetical protein
MLLWVARTWNANRKASSRAHARGGILTARARTKRARVVTATALQFNATCIDDEISHGRQ